MELADHIIKWTDILTKGPHAFEKALNKERRRMNWTPIVFAIMEPRSNKVQLAHSFEDIAVDNEEHDANESVGFFLGDRVTVIIDNVPTQHDPPFWTVTTFNELTSQFKGKHANAVACSKAQGTLLVSDPRARTVNTPKLFQVPMPWCSFFLTKARTVTKAHNWITATTCSWNLNTKAKTASIIACQWTCTTCTSDLDAMSNSTISIKMLSGPPTAYKTTSHGRNKAPALRTSWPWLSPTRTCQRTVQP
jgi:hypothetical protein